MIDSFILILGIVLLFAVLFQKVMQKFGIPTLILFLFLGILLGNDFLNIIDFHDYELTNSIAILGLIIIIFTGGFETNFLKAKHNLKISVILASIGVVLTALLTGLFVHVAFNTKIWSFSTQCM